MAVLLNKADLLAEEQIQELQEWYMSNCRAEKVGGCLHPLLHNHIRQ
jgi:hypothetical protein